jgi:hypothetical protein
MASSAEATSQTKAPTILERIYAQRAKDVELAKSTPGTTPEDMKVYLDELKLAPPLISFVDRLTRNPGQLNCLFSLSPFLLSFLPFSPHLIQCASLYARLIKYKL